MVSGGLGIEPSSATKLSDPLRLGLSILFILSSVATIWLWREWSFVDQPPWLSGLLVLNSVLLVFIFLDSWISIFKAKSFRHWARRWQFLVAMGLMTICTVVLAVDTFYWLKVYFLPVQITFVVVNAVLFAKRRGWIGKKKVEALDAPSIDIASVGDEP